VAAQIERVEADSILDGGHGIFGPLVVAGDLEGKS
jgi:hypothetical protein